MPKQIGTLPISGSLDNFTFYEHPEYGHLMKRKGGPTREMVKKGSQYDITRRNNSEFGRASHYGALIRNAFRPMIQVCKETRLDVNLSGRLRALIKMDTESEFGSRDLRRNTLAAFRHFELNSKSPSKQYFKFPMDITMAKGCLEVLTGIFFKNKLQAADAWQVRSMAVSIDLVNDTLKRDIQQSDIHELKKGEYALGFTHYPDEQMLTFYGICIVFYNYDIVTDEYQVRKDIKINSGFIRYIGDQGV